MVNEKIFDNAEKFIKKCNNKFGKKFNYNIEGNFNLKNKIEITCNIHNITFRQLPTEHLRGKNGCKKCAGRIVDTESFIDKLKTVHGNKYDYTNTKYINSKTKATITCPKHGNFYRLPSAYKQGCPHCYNSVRGENKKLTKDRFIERANLKHNNKYDYSLVRYKSSKDKVKIICPKHGVFEQLPSGHIRGRGCSKCAINKTKKQITKRPTDFINQSKIIHNNKYDYSLVKYKNSKTKVSIVCPKHGVFEQKPECHVNGHGCKFCGNYFNNCETAIKDYIKMFKVRLVNNSRKILGGVELDIYVPSHKIAIEYNGLYWHSEQYKDDDYHLNKTEKCEENGIRLIHIFEDEWLYKTDIVKSRLKTLFGLVENKIYARKCDVKTVKPAEAKNFLLDNHIQGVVNSKYWYGLYYEGELVSLMGLGNFRKINSKTTKRGGFELLRFCNKLNTTVVGGASKLLKHFIKTHNPEEIISYADRRWSQGDLYEKLGFEFSHNSKPNYWYVMNKERKHRFSFRKQILIKEGFDPNKTEREIMLDRGVYRIYDCGSKVYKLKLK